MTRGRWNIDTAHSGILFTVRHMVGGMFDRWDGSLAFDTTDRATPKVSVCIEVASIDTREAKRDEQFCSADFHDTEHDPEIAIRECPSGVARAGEVRAFGNLTMHGVTREVARTTGVSMQNTKPAPHEQILSIVVGFWQARALAVATELGLPDLLAERPLHVDELASRTKTNASALFRLLRALESMDIFIQVTPRVFFNTATSESLRRGVLGSQWPTVLHCLSKGNGPFEGWDELEYSVRTGEPSLKKIYGYDYWELLRRNPQANAAQNGAMRSASAAMTPAITAAYEWNQFSVIADIGGGIGTQLASILDAAPSSRGILFDQPHLGADSISHERMETIGGDFFHAVPAGADAYLLRFILHDWADEQADAILRSVRRAVKPTARLILIESVIPDGSAFTFGKWTDLQMLVCAGGCERTEPEYRALLSSAGFALQEVIVTDSSLSLLVAEPAWGEQS